MVKFSVFGIKFSVSVGFIGVIALMQYIDSTGLLIPTFWAVIFHECGHLFAMCGLRCKPREIVLKVGTAAIDTDYIHGGISEVIIILAGPVCNFVFSALLLILFKFLNKEIFLTNSLVMFAVGGYNLLPASGLDGGSLVLIGLRRVFRLKNAQLIGKIISLSVGGVTVFVGLYFFLKGNNPSLVIMGIYLVSITLIKKC